MKFIILSLALFQFNSAYSTQLITSEDIEISYLSKPKVFSPNSTLGDNAKALHRQFLHSDLKHIQKTTNSAFTTILASPVYTIKLQRIDISLLNLDVEIPGDAAIPENTKEQIKNLMGCTDALVRASDLTGSCTDLITKFNPPLIRGPVRKEITVPYLSYQVSFNLRSSQYKVEIDENYPCKENPEIAVKRSLYVYPYSLHALRNNTNNDFYILFKTPDVRSKDSNACGDFNEILLSIY